MLDIDQKLQLALCGQKLATSVNAEFIQGRRSLWNDADNVRTTHLAAKILLNISALILNISYLG